MRVERISYLYEEQISDFIDDIQNSFRSDVPKEAMEIRKALSIVRLGAVTEYALSSSENRLEAQISGMQPETIELSFHTMKTACTCNEPNWCIHKMAVVLHLYSQFHSLIDWNHQWQQIDSGQMSLTMPERTPEAWNRSLAKLTAPLSNIDVNENPHIFVHEASLLDEKAASLSPFEWEWKPLFDLFYRLHLLDAGWQYAHHYIEASAGNFSYRHWQIRMWVNEQLAKIQDQANLLGSKHRLFETDVFYTQLKTSVRRFVLQHEGLFEDRFYLYEIFWTSLFKEKATREKELSGLMSENEPDAKFFAALFHLLSGDVEALSDMVEQMDDKRIGHWMKLSEKAAELEEYKALSILLSRILPHIEEYYEQLSKHERSYFIRHFDGLLEDSDFPEEQRESLFMMFGKDGLDTYADFLVEHGRYADWAALMHRYNVSYDSMEMDALKMAALEAPAAVLPLLHNFAMGYIAEKNRHGYRRAVKIFKTMKSCSKRSGKIDFWNRYVDTIRNEHRRLRALSEEMERSNLHL